MRRRAKHDWSRQGLRTPLVMLGLGGLVLVGLQLASARADIIVDGPSMSGRTYDFLVSLGVNTHLEYTDSAYADVGRVIADLNYIGIHNLRDGTPQPNGGIPYNHYLSALQQVGFSGNRFDLVTGTGQSLVITLGAIQGVAVERPGSLVAVEGPNEINNAPASYLGLHGEAAALVFQKDLYSSVHKSSVLKNVSVYLYTGGGSLDIEHRPGLADAANQHPYPNQGEQPGQHIASSFAGMFGNGAYKKVITEIGYFSQPTIQTGNSVDAATQAKGTLNLLFDAYKQGIDKTYLYQLLNAYPGNQQNTDSAYGLFRFDNTPTLAATALHAMTGILAKGASTAPVTGVPATPRPVRSLHGLPALAECLLLQKRVGVYDLVIWAEPPFWNQKRHRRLRVWPTDVTIDLVTAARAITVFDPMTGLRPVRSLADASSLDVPISDHPLIIEIQLKATGP